MLTRLAVTCPAMARPRLLVRDPRKLKTTQRTYRLDAILLESFEGDCARNLFKPKQVIEALIREWLDANDARRAAITERHRRWIGVA